MAKAGRKGKAKDMSFPPTNALFNGFLLVS